MADKGDDLLGRHILEHVKPRRVFRRNAVNNLLRLAWPHGKF
ncbi:MAG: hypothetical protein ACI906_004071 [Candidatus Latescibacterota bacterium]|jgi:hypothetical protein